MTIRPAIEASPHEHVDVLIIGAGGCGLVAALAASDAGARVAIVERDQVPRGNTSWSVGMVPAAGSRIQREAGIEDDAALFAGDIFAKTKNKVDPVMVRLAAEQSGPAMDWLTQVHGLQFVLLTEIIFPGHSRHRYHVPVAAITGEALHAMLMQAAGRAGIPILTGREAKTLFVDENRRVMAAGGDDWTIGCDALILATDGFAANPDLVREYIPDMADAISFGHGGARGDSLIWGQGLGAATADLGAYQGHNLVYPQILPMIWTIVINGGIQVNSRGRRFANEMRGYSEQAADIMAQPGGVAWTVYSEAGERNAEILDTYRAAQDAGVLVRAADVKGLADATGLPLEALQATLQEAVACERGEAEDVFGRDFTTSPPLAAPYVAVRVTGALYHTQGGLVIDQTARLVDLQGERFPNLFAGGGAARGVSGPSAAGYLGGNGLLCAIVFGRVAGTEAARLVNKKSS